MSSAIPRPEDYKYQNSGAPRTVTGAAPLKPYVVSYKDGEGRPQTRICFRTEDGSATFVVQEKVAGQMLTVSANAWFHKGLSEKLQEDVEPESI